MSLAPGTRAGPYEIVSRIGAGGMGEVFRARDTKLGREVAIKVLPAAFAKDSERVARFRREAQVLASLHHPNIASIFGLEEANGLVALALELVGGEDLAKHLTRGPIQLDDAIAIARQIAEGLEAAHEKGIVHRDLKPANLILTNEGAVKILDFGLAKALEGDKLDARDNDLSHSPTMARPMTEDGMILGTAAYMSPEQARGKAVDKRSDIWSFGVVVFEMLTGRRLFGGETVSDTLAAVLRQDVDLDALPAGTPHSLRRLLERCLERDPRRRLRDIGEARLALEAPALAEGGTAEAGAAASPAAADKRTRIAWALAAVALLALLALAWVQFGRQEPSRRAMRLTFEPPQGVFFDASETDFVTVSPNGRMLTFTGRTPDGRRQLWVRSLDALDARPLPDSDDPLEPFWSHDSRSIAFGTKGKLRRVDLASGRAQTLADAPRMVGGSWNREGVILFVPDFNVGVFRVPAQGGEVTPVTRLDAARQETGHRSPEFLPDGRHFLFTGGHVGDRHVFVGSLDSPEVKPLVAGAAIARYAPPGWLLFPRDGELWAQGFDADRMEFSGDPVAISRAQSDGSASFDVPGAASHFSASENGVLVWQRNFTPDYQLVWFERDGRRTGVVGGPVQVAVTMSPKFSPDGRRVAIQNRDPRPDRLGIWVIDLERAIPTRLSSVMGQFPQWSPDGSRVAWVFARQGVVGIYQKAANGVGDEELLIKAGPEAGGNTFPSDWSSDGRFILYTTRGPKTRLDTWALPLAGNLEPHPVLASGFDEHASQLSPDGRWIAYRSDESGSYEIYLQSFTADGRAGGEKWRVSRSGGHQPRFRPDGRELLFLAADGQMMAVALEPKGAALEYGAPKALFPTRTLPQGGSPSFEYDVTRDGQRFLIGTILDGPNATPPSPVIVLDWTEDLKNGVKQP